MRRNEISTNVAWKPKAYHISKCHPSKIKIYLRIEGLTIFTSVLEESLAPPWEPRFKHDSAVPHSSLQPYVGSSCLGRASDQSLKPLAIIILWSLWSTTALFWDSPFIGLCSSEGISPIYWLHSLFSCRDYYLVSALLLLDSNISNRPIRISYFYSAKFSFP